MKDEWRFNTLLLSFRSNDRGKGRQTKTKTKTFVLWSVCFACETEQWVHDMFVKRNAL